MKQYVKKLLSILTALALLISVALPAGVIPAFAATEDGDEDAIPPVGINATEITFTSTNTNWRDGGVYRNSAQSAATPYTLSFEYYLPYGETVKFSSVAGSITPQAGSTSLTLKPGYHTFVANMTTTASNNTYAPELICSSGDATLYIWNYSGVKLNGETLTKADSIASAAAAVEGSDLTTYGWYAHKDHAFVTELDFAGATTEAPKTWTDAPGMYFGGVDTATAYTVSFDYYVPSAINSLEMESNSGYEKTVAGSKVLDGTVGIHSASWTMYSGVDSTDDKKDGQFGPRIVCDTDVVLYIWNYKVEQNGMEVDSKTNVNGSITSAITPAGGKELCQYPWYVVLPTEGDVVAYVNSAGENTESYLMNKDYPFKTINDAIKALNAVEGDKINRVIKLVGTYDATALAVDKNNGSLGLATHTNLITIDGVANEENPPLLNLSNFYTIGGPLKIDNLGLGFIKNDSELRLNGNELKIGSGVTLTTVFRSTDTQTGGGRIVTGGWHNTLTSGTTSSTAALEHNVTVDGGYFDSANLGFSDIPNDKTFYIDGANLVINGGTVKTVNIGSIGWNTQGKGVFQKNVNVTINGGTINKINSGARGTGAGSVYMHSYTNGAALQIILNNGVSIPTKTFADAAATTVDGTSVGETVYLLQVAAHDNGFTLATTDTAGVYDVVGELGDLIPVAYQNGAKVEGAVYDSDAKTLTVPAAGTYDVKWEKAPIKGDAIAYVKQDATTAGDIYDSNNGTVDAAEANCYPTLKAAMTALENRDCAGTRIIKIVDDYTVSSRSDYAVHNNWITIEGANGTDNLLLFSASAYNGFGGPLALDNISYRTSSAQIYMYATGQPFILGENAVYSDGEGDTIHSARFYIGNANGYTPLHAGNNYTYKLLGNNNKLFQLYLGGSAATEFNGDVNVLIEGGSIKSDLYIGSNATFNNNVNIQIDGGSVTTWADNGIRFTGSPTFADGAALQIIINNGKNAVTKNLTAPTSGAGLYLIKVAAHNGVTLSATPDKGVYDVVGELGEYIPVVYDAEGNKVAGATYSNGQLTIPAAGTYTVEWNGPSLEVTKPTKTEYYKTTDKMAEESLSLDGMTVTHIAADGTVTSLASTQYTVDSSAFNSKVAGEYTITVSYAGLTESFTVKVVDPTVTEINFATANTQYQMGKWVDTTTGPNNPYVVSFDYYLPSGMTAVLNFPGGWITGDTAIFETGAHSYSGEYYMSDSANVSYLDRMIFCVKGTAVGKVYIWNFKVTVNGVDVTANAGIEGGITTASATKNETLSSYLWYPYMYDTLAVTTKPYKTEYWLGDTLNTDGLQVTWYDKNGAPVETVTEGFDVAYDFSTAGTKTVTVSYKTYLFATFEVTVKDPMAPVYHLDFDSVDYAEKFGIFDSNGDPNGNLNHVRKVIYRPHNLSVGASSGTIEYTFEYYMPEQSPIYVSVGNDENQLLADKETGSAYLQQGHHTFTCTFDIEDYSHGSNMFVAFATSYNPYADDADGSRNGKVGEFSLFPQDIYVWNVKMTNKTTGADRGTTYADAQGIAADCLSTTEEFDKRTMVNYSYVYELDFSNMTEYADATAWMPPVRPLGNRPTNDANEYVISFDYFLDETDAHVRAFFDPHDNFTNADGGTTLRNIAEGENNDYDLDVGRHSFKAIITRDMIANASGCAPFLRFELNYGIGSKPAKLYVWNVKFICTSGNDTVFGNLVEGAPVYTSSTNCSVTRTTTLPENLSSVTELDLYGAQVRTDKALRFVAAIKGANITRQDNGEALYGNTATITIGGITYNVMGAGILFGRDLKIADLGKAPEDALTLGNEGGGKIYKIPAVKLQKAEHHATYLGQGVQGVVFTGVITNIPRANWGESLSARVYMELKDSYGNEIVYYGGIISRSLNEVNAITQPNNLNPNELMSSTDEMYEAASEFKQTYITAKDGNTAIPANAKVYYVSADDTGENVLRTLDEVNALSAGTANNPVVVLFERGGEYRGHIEVKNYTTYGAYGVGAKPFINASLKNYAKLPVYEYGADVSSAPALYWQELHPKYGNRWQLVGMGALLGGDANIGTKVGNNVGSMYFFDDEDTMIAYGSKSMKPEIYQDFEFYHEITRDTLESGDVSITAFGDLYVYLPEGKTPANYAKIEIAHHQSAIVGSSTEDVQLKEITIDNLCVKYTGVHGISLSSGYEDAPVFNITITNCEIGWIGGSVMRYGNRTGDDYTDDVDVRLGNGIELNGNIDGAVVSNNWIYQCYDAGYSNQGTGGIAQDITVNYNLIEYCAYSIEIWENEETGLMKNCHYVNNFMRFAGYEFERDNRIGGEQTAISHVNFMSGVKPCENVTVSDNVFDTSYVSMIVAGYPNSTDENTANDNAGSSLENSTFYKNDKTGPAVSRNTWVQGYDQYSKLAYLWKNDNIDDEQEQRSANSKADMIEQLSEYNIDPNPVDVIFYK